MNTVQMWIRAARAFASLSEQLNDVDWDAPGLGEWSVRDLVGHATSAGLEAVAAAVDTRADREAITTPEGYYAFGRSLDPATFAAAVAASTQDARRAGDALGADPGPAVRSLVETTVTRVSTVEETTVL